jgi:uncharacterized protein YjbI with pentapeptide repeats
MITAPELDKASRPEPKAADRLTRKDLRDALENHGSCIDSAGETGARADFSGKNLEFADLVDARLPNAFFHKTILRGADLTLADLREATLVQANLAEANLLATQLQQANLQAADMHGATGLLGPQLAGTNLFGAVLPEAISPVESLKHVREVAIKGGWLMGLTLLLDGLVGLRIFTTPDSQLVNNSAALPFSGLQTTLPFIPFYLFGPVVILCLYLCFHLYMQRLWDGIAQLPAIFPDGRRLDACLPWFARWSARMHFKWLRKSQSPLAFLEAAIAILLLYWVAPVTVLLFWGRYMTLEDLRGTTLHILLVVGAIAAAMNFPRMAGKSFGSDFARLTDEQKLLNKRTSLLLRGVPPAIGLLLFLLSIGTFLGVPHDSRATGQSPAIASGALWIRSWAPDILWTVGYNPFAQLTEAEVSTKPPGWTGQEGEIAQVKGANLNRLRLRYIQAYGAFLVKAHLWRTDLRNAYLSEADLREANLRQVDLQFAVLDGAKLTRATLPEADLRNANLDRADLRDANLSFAVLSEATLLDATIDGANLYKSDLHSALLQRASLKKTDLREANLENSNLTMANLGESYLISTNLNNARLKNADLSKAILTDASLRKSDLSGAHLEGAVLQGADLAGANLQGADLRGAEGLTAAQVCSAANVREAQMDAGLQQDVTNLCGNMR